MNLTLVDVSIVSSDVRALRYIMHRWCFLFFMNVVIQGSTKELEIMYTCGTSIRYVHIPPDIKIRSHMSSYV